MKNRMDGVSVYSTEHGRLCPDCGQQIDKCTCRSGQLIPQTDGIVRVSRETKGRKGKGVTLIAGLPLVGDELKKLSTQLKQKCGCGGTVKNGTIEIQGDHRDELITELQARGFTVKRSGG
ncbi:MAG: translation initiation factor Sui1 [Phycisphaerae bacterium]|nr:translation initiation factor Sui1 [Phycisphaerae bacterium]